MCDKCMLICKHNYEQPTGFIDVRPIDGFSEFEQRLIVGGVKYCPCCGQNLHRYSPQSGAVFDALCWEALEVIYKAWESVGAV